MIQGSQEWLEARLGRVTASRIADLTARTKSGWGASRANYMAELLVERLTGAPAERYTNAAMEWGTATEGDARVAYEFIAGSPVLTVGFVEHPDIAMAGASPDGLVGEDGLVEIKCPNTATHLETVLGGAIPDKYVAQMQFQMACTGRDWCDWVSFDPRLPERMRLVIRRVPRHQASVTDIETHVRNFLAELDEKVARLTAVAATPAHPASSVLMAG